MIYKKIFISVLLILAQSRSLQAAEHQAVDANKWIYPVVALAGIGISLMLYNYYFGKQKTKKTGQFISNVRGKNVRIRQTVSGVRGGVEITQNAGGKSIQTISMGNEIVNVNGYIVPPVGTNTTFTQENDIFYINDQKADFIESSGENIRKKFFVDKYSAINIPSNLVSVAHDVNNIAENQVEIEIDKAFADDVKIQNENGTLKLCFIPKVPPRAYYVGDNIIAKITSIKHNIDIRNTGKISTIEQSIN